MTMNPKKTIIGTAVAVTLGAALLAGCAQNALGDDIDATGPQTSRSPARPSP
jgi:hypothetical protein